MVCAGLRPDALEALPWRHEPGGVHTRRSCLTMFAADPADVLLTLAEVSIAFAGFSSLIAVVGMRSEAPGESFDLVRYWIMLEFSLAALAFSLLPFVLTFLGVPDTAGWRSLSGLIAVFVVVHNIVLGVMYRRGNEALRRAATPASLVPANIVYAATVASQLGNAFGWLDATFGWYLFGLALVLVVASAHFIIFIAHALRQLGGSR